MRYKPYFDILNLPVSASIKEIKLRYRELAKQYHPDIHPNQSNHLRFSQINEAYHYLIEHYESIQIDLIQATKQTANIKSKHNVMDKKQRYEQAVEIKKKQQANEASILNHHYAKITLGWKWKLFQLSCIFSLLLAIAMVADYFLTPNYESDRIKAYHLKDAVNTMYDVFPVETDYHGTFYIDQFYYNTDYIYASGTKAYIETSSILHIPLRILTQSKGNLFPIEPKHTLSEFIPLFIILLLVPIITLIYKRKNMIFVVLHLFSFYFVSILLLVLLFYDKRIIHLFTLGTY